MKKKLVIIISVIVLVFNFVSSLSVSAYTGASSLYTITFNKTSNKFFSFSADGVLLIHSFFRTSVDISSLASSERNLDLTYFVSGTWQGRDVSELSSDKICDQSDTVGFSQTVSYSYEDNYFVYSVVICLPCVKGDSFYLRFAKSPYAVSTSYYSLASQLLGVTGVKKVYTDSSSFYTDEPVSYTTKSNNQHLICLFSSHSFNPAFSLSCSSSEYLASDYLNISRIASVSYSSVYTSNYGLDSGSDLSLHLLENISSWSFSVYEIFTDGTYIPGYDDGASDDDSGSGGSGAVDITVNVDVDMSGTESRLDKILEAIKNAPKEFWEVYKSGLQELFGIEERPPPDTSTDESSETDSTEPTENSPPFEIDEEQFDSAMEYVNPDQLVESISGPHGSIMFFWHFADRFFLDCNLYPIIALSLIFCMAVWLLRS